MIKNNKNMMNSFVKKTSVWEALNEIMMAVAYDLCVNIHCFLFLILLLLFIIQIRIASDCCFFFSF